MKLHRWPFIVAATGVYCSLLPLSLDAQDSQVEADSIAAVNALSALFSAAGQAPGSSPTVLDPFERRPLNYTYLREADVMWSKRTWRVIDLKEKINLPFGYPLSQSMRDRRSLIDVVMDAAEEGSLTLYSSADDEFTVPLTSADFRNLGGAGSDTVTLQYPDPPYLEYDTIITRVFSRDKVIAYRLKEDWFFDKQRSVIECRIIGFAPLIYAVDEYGNTREGNIKVPLFWVYYPEVRGILAGSLAFNMWNDMAQPSFDDLFVRRRFSSYITKESNVYDRRIEDYAQGLNALLESERIKSEIVNLEHDLWEY